MTTNPRVTGVAAATDLSSSSSASVDAVRGTSVFQPSSSLPSSSMAAPSSSAAVSTASSAASAAAPKKFYVVSHLGGSQNEISPTEDKAKAVFEKVQVEFEALCDKIRHSKGASFADRAIDINVTRGTYRYLEDGITIEEPLEDLQRPADFVSPSGSADETVLNREYKDDILGSLRKIETLLRESKAVNFGGALPGSVVRPSSTYFASSIALDSASTPSLGAVVKKAKKYGVKSLEDYYPEIMQQVLAAGASKTTLARVIARFDNIQKYHNKFLEELSTLPIAKTDTNLIALAEAMNKIDWFAVAVGIAFRELANDPGIKKQDLEIARNAIEVIAEKERAKGYEGKLISRIRSLPDVSETEERARLGYEASLTEVIRGKGQKKSIEEVLVTIAFMENTARNNNIPWASVFDGVSPFAARAIKLCDAVALGIGVSTEFFGMDEEIKDIVARVDEKDPTTLATFVSQMSTRLRTPPPSRAQELVDSDMARVMASEQDVLADGELDQELDNALDLFDPLSRRRGDSDMSSLIDMDSDAQAGPSSRAVGGQPRDLLAE